MIKNGKLALKPNVEDYEDVNFENNETWNEY